MFWIIQVARHGVAWAETASPELLKVLSKAEISRQNDIHSIIQLEVEYLTDLKMLDKVRFQVLIVFLAYR
jgi:hypothetical protein